MATFLNVHFMICCFGAVTLRHYNQAVPISFIICIGHRSVWHYCRLTNKLKVKNPAYGRHWISRPMRIIGPIFFFGGDGKKKRKKRKKMWHVTCDTWHVTRDTWHVTCDTWHLTPDTWHVTPNLCHLSHVTSHLSLQEQPQPQTLPCVTCPVGAQ